MGVAMLLNHKQHFNFNIISILSFFFLIESKKLHGSPLCRCPMKSALTAQPKVSAQNTSISTSVGTGAPEARE